MNNTPQLRFPGFTGEWSEKKLGEIGDTYSGLSGKTKEDFDKGGSKFVTFINVLKNVRIDMNILGDVDIKTGEKQNKIEYGDMLFNTSSETPEEVGFCSVFDSKTEDAVYLNSFCFGYRFKDIDKHKPLFMAYYLRSCYGRELMHRLAQGITRFNLSKEYFNKANVCFPSPAEQQKIADCLSALDDLISAQGEKVDALKTRKKGLMQQLFPQNGETTPRLRFPGFTGEWSERTFEECFEIGSGRDYKHLAKGDIPVYGSGGYMCSVNDYLYDGESACIGRKGTINNPILLKGKFWTVDTLFYTYNFVDTTAYFVYLLFQNIDWMKHNEAGGVPSLSKNIIYKLKAYLPSPAEQQKIASCLSALDDLIASESAELEALKAHKKGLMQQLFPEPAK